MTQSKKTTEVHNYLVDILEHQKLTRKAIEEIFDSLESFSHISTEIEVIKVRLQTLEKTINNIDEEQKECKKGINCELRDLKDTLARGSQDIIVNRGALQEDMSKYKEVISNRLSELESRIAEMSGKYGVISSFAVVALFEIIKWILGKR